MGFVFLSFLLLVVIGRVSFDVRPHFPIFPPSRLFSSLRLLILLLSSDLGPSFKEILNPRHCRLLVLIPAPTQYLPLPHLPVFFFPLLIHVKLSLEKKSIFFLSKSQFLKWKRSVKWLYVGCLRYQPLDCSDSALIFSSPCSYHIPHPP